VRGLEQEPFLMGLGALGPGIWGASQPGIYRVSFLGGTSAAHAAHIRRWHHPTIGAPAGHAHHRTCRPRSARSHDHGDARTGQRRWHVGVLRAGGRVRRPSLNNTAGRTPWRCRGGDISALAQTCTADLVMGTGGESRCCRVGGRPLGGRRAKYATVLEASGVRAPMGTPRLATVCWSWRQPPR